MTERAQTFSSPSDVVIGTEWRHLRCGRSWRGHERAHHEVRQEREVHQGVGRAGHGPCGTGEFSAFTRSRSTRRAGSSSGSRQQPHPDFDQDGNSLDCWYQFGRPSGIYIDAHDNIYVADSESSTFVSRAGPAQPGGARDPSGQCEGWVSEILHSGPRSLTAALAQRKASLRPRTESHLRRRSRTPKASFATTNGDAFYTLNRPPAFHSKETRTRSEKNRISVVRALEGLASVAGALGRRLADAVHRARRCRRGIGRRRRVLSRTPLRPPARLTVPALSAIGARTGTIEIGTAVIDMRYENPLYMVEDAGAADLIADGRLQLGISRFST